MEVNKSKIENYLLENKNHINDKKTIENKRLENLYEHFDLRCQQLTIPRTLVLSKCALTKEQVKASEAYNFIRFRPSKYSVLVSKLTIEKDKLYISHRFYPPKMRLHLLIKAVTTDLDVNKRSLIFIPSRAHRRHFDIEHLAAQCSRAAIKRYLPKAMIANNDCLIRAQEAYKLNATGQRCHDLLENLPPPSDLWRQSPLAQHYFQCIAEAANQDMLELIKLQSPMQKA